MPFQDSACVKFANIPLAIAGHTANPRVGEDHTKVSTLGVWSMGNPHMMVLTLAMRQSMVEGKKEKQ